MGILDRHHQKAGGAWRAGEGLALDLDLDRNALAGIQIGDPQTLLWKLGPAQDAGPRAEGEHAYYSLGVAAATRQGKIITWRIYWNDPGRLFATFTGTCLYRGKVVDLNAGQVEKTVAGWLGEPLWRTVAGGAVHLFYAHHAVEWELTFAEGGGLETLVMSALPLYAAAGSPRPVSP